jgi:hypothetical protein
MRWRPEAAGESGQGSREEGYRNIRAGRCSGTTSGYRTRLSRSLTGCSRPGQQPGFAAAPAQTGLLSKPKKTVSLKCPPNEGVC